MGWDGLFFEWLVDGGVLIIKRWTATNLEPIEDVIRLSEAELNSLVNGWRNYVCRA